MIIVAAVSSERYLTIKEYAAEVRVNERTVRAWINKGAIPPEEHMEAPIPGRRGYYYVKLPGGSVRIVERRSLDRMAEPDIRGNPSR